MCLLDQLPKLCSVNRITDLTLIKERFESSSLNLRNSKGLSDLLGVDVFVFSDRKHNPLDSSGWLSGGGRLRRLMWQVMISTATLTCQFWFSNKLNTQTRVCYVLIWFVICSCKNFYCNPYRWTQNPNNSFLCIDLICDLFLQGFLLQPLQVSFDFQITPKSKQGFVMCLSDF